MWRWLVATAAVLGGDVATAQDVSPAPSFQQRLVAVVAKPQPTEAKRVALIRLSRDAQGNDEQAAVAAFRTMVDGWTKDRDKALADAEALAAANPRSGAAHIALSYARTATDEPELAAD